MEQDSETPAQRRFWIVVGTITFGSIGIPISIIIIQAFFGEGGGFPGFLGQMLFFGLMMIGFLNLVFSFYKRERNQKINWADVSLYAAWTVFFGWAFIINIDGN